MMILLFLICPLLILPPRERVDCDILVPPTDVEVQRGESTTLVCTSNSSYVRWKQVPYQTDESFSINLRGDMIDRFVGRFLVDPDCVHGQCNLEIQNIQHTDAGSYCCIDRDGTGTKYCSELTVIQELECRNSAEAAGIVGGNSCDIPPHVGTQHHHYCIVSYRGDKSPVLRWRDSQNNTVPVEMVETKSTMNTISSVMTISLLESRPRDTFTCESTVSKASCRSTIMQQYAYESTLVLSVSGGVVACTANSSVPCAYHWVNLPDTEVFQHGSTLNLSASKVVPGTYRCLADCNIGGHRCRITAMTLHYTPDEDCISYGRMAFWCILAIIIVLVLPVSLMVALILLKRIQVGNYLIKFEKQNGPPGFPGPPGGSNEHGSSIPEIALLNGHSNNGVAF